MSFQRRNQGTSHRYTLDGAEIPGATTVIGTLDKPALVGWAANQTAAYADEHWERLSNLRSADRIEELKKARYATNKKAVVKGNRVHALGERLAKGEAPDVPAELAGPVGAYARFLDTWDFQTVATETPVCNKKFAYGGTLDLLVDSDRFGRVLLDLKTGKGVYPEVSLQLAAYRYADTRLVEEPRTGPRGGRLPSEWVEAPMLAVDKVMVAHVREDTVDLVPVVADGTVWQSFLYLLEVHYGWARRVGWKYRDGDEYSPTVGAPLYPEDELPVMFR